MFTRERSNFFFAARGYQIALSLGVAENVEEYNKSFDILYSIYRED